MNQEINIDNAYISGIYVEHASIEYRTSNDDILTLEVPIEYIANNFEEEDEIEIKISITKKEK